VNRLAVSIAGGALVGAVALCVLGVMGWAAGNLAGLSLSFHSGVSPFWILVFVAVLLGGGIAASWSAVRFYGSPSWSASVGASTGLAALMTLPFVNRSSPGLVWTGLAVALVFALMTGIIVAAMTGAGRSQDDK